MSSSHRTRSRGKAVAAEPPAAPTPAASDNIPDGRDSDAAADPWFTPGPKRTAAPPADWSDEALPPPGADDRPADWFLPTGRAGLRPDSITDFPADGLATIGPPAHVEAASSPPWAADSASPAAGAPPPWENGPWPGPGETAPRREPGSPISRSGPAELADDRTIAGLLQRRSVRLAVAGCAAAVVLIVIIVVIVTTSGGGCGTYPAAVRQAYASAMADLRNHASAPVQLAAFQHAASRANASAAAAGQIAVRTALFTMAGDLDQAYADMTAHRALPPALLQHLTADGTALPASC
jgi:hypothetical protein